MFNMCHCPMRNRSLSFSNYTFNPIESKSRCINASCKNLIKRRYDPNYRHKRNDIECGIEAAGSQEVWIVDASVYTFSEFDIEALRIASWHAGIYIDHALELTIADGPVYDAFGDVNHGP